MKTSFLITFWIIVAVSECHTVPNLRQSNTHGTTEAAVVSRITTSPETTTLDTTLPETTTSETTTPEAVPPETTATETTTCKTTTSETTTPETTLPETTTSETTTPEAVTPETTATETTTCKTTTPETTRPEAITPETKTTEAITPETTTPKTTPFASTTPEITAKETSESQTQYQLTSLVVPPPTSKPVRNHYVIRQDGITCFVMDAAIAIDIKYSSADKIRTVSISIPKNANSEGLCDQARDENILMISFFRDTWHLNITVAMDTMQQRTAANDITTTSNVNDITTISDVRYSWRRIDLQYIQDLDRFPEAIFAPNAVKHVYTVLQNHPFAATNASSYKCDARTEVALETGITLEISELRYRAFGMGTNITLQDQDSTVCDGDMIPVDDYFLPIAVAYGSILAVLCVGLIIVNIYLQLQILGRNTTHHTQSEGERTPTKQMTTRYVRTNIN